MVRFVKLITKGFAPEKVSEQDEEFRVFGEGENFQSKHQQQFYDDLIRDTDGIVEYFKHEGQIKKDNVNRVVSRIVEEFTKEPYSYLLLSAFSYIKGDYLVAHMVNDTILTVGFSKYLGLTKEELAEIGRCALLHDIGMVDLKRVYNKRYRISQRKFRKVRGHVLKTLECVQDIFSEEELEIISDVHEREKGQGYPKGKRSEDITSWAKIIAVCDVYEALTHRRSFRSDYSPFEAMKMLIKMKEDLLDEWFTKKFIEYLSIHPVGSLVYLSTGEVGLVIKGNAQSPTKPVVRILVTPEHRIEPKYRVINLSDDHLTYIREPLERSNERKLLSLLKPRGEQQKDYLINN